MLLKKLNKKNQKINEDNLKRYLQTKDIPDPDLLIRTGNTHRLSNFFIMAISLFRNFFCKKNYGLILMKKITIRLLRILN